MGVWRLTTAERRRILLTHIYGVDIDPQAVEVTKLSLLLKVLEGETADNIARQMDLFNVRALPDLGANIRCGNSLVASDFYSQHEMGIFSEAELFRINAFDWSDEFQFCGKDGGFDAVIGNPPYGATLIVEEKKYFKDKYRHQSYQYDSYLLFIERAISKLLRGGGHFGMIIPNPWLTNLNQAALRTYVVNHTTLQDIVHFGFPVFSKAKAIVDTEIVIFRRQAARRNKFTARFVRKISPAGEIEGFDKVIKHRQSDWKKLANQSLNIFLDEERVRLAAQVLSSGERCDRFLSWNVGMKPYQTGKGKPKQGKQDVEDRKFDSDVKRDNSYRQYVRGADFEQFLVRPLQERWIKYGPWLAEPRIGAQFDSPQKILVRQTGDSLVAAIDRNKLICMNNVHVGVPLSEEINMEYVLGVLNSTLMNWVYHSLNPEMGEVLAEVKKENVARLPVIRETASNVRLIEEIARHAANLENLRQRMSNARTEAERLQLSRREAAESAGLNEKVFVLYGIDPADRDVILEDERKGGRRKSNDRATG